MARKPILPGQSRSTKCSTRSCQRLMGHKGEHRSTLTAVASPKVPVVFDKTLTLKGETWHIVVLADGTTSSTKVVEVAGPKVLTGGVEVHSADRYTVQPDRPAKARKAKVRNLRFVAPKERIGISGVVGRQRPARRAKAAPQVAAAR